jgi:hypothetical protein
MCLTPCAHDTLLCVHICMCCSVCTRYTIMYVCVALCTRYTINVLLCAHDTLLYVCMCCSVHTIHYYVCICAVFRVVADILMHYGHGPRPRAAHCALREGKGRDLNRELELR